MSPMQYNGPEAQPQTEGTLCTLFRRLAEEGMRQEEVRLAFTGHNAAAKFAWAMGDHILPRNSFRGKICN